MLPMIMKCQFNVTELNFIELQWLEQQTVLHGNGIAEIYFKVNLMYLVFDVGLPCSAPPVLNSTSTRVLGTTEPTQSNQISLGPRKENDQGNHDYSTPDPSPACTLTVNLPLAFMILSNKYFFKCFKLLKIQRAGGQNLYKYTHAHTHTPALLLLLCAKVEEPELNSVFLQDPSFMMCHFDCMTFSRHNLSLGPVSLDK